MYIFAGGVCGVLLDGCITPAEGNPLKDKVAIPEQVWKVALVLNRSGLSLGEINSTNAKMIAVLMPNDPSDATFLDKDWNDPAFLVTVDDIEALTNYNFFSELPDAVEGALESSPFDGTWFGRHLSRENLMWILLAN